MAITSVEEGMWRIQDVVYLTFPTYFTNFSKLLELYGPRITNKTCLHFAVTNRHNENIVKILLENGADPYIASVSGKLPISNQLGKLRYKFNFVAIRRRFGEEI